MISGVKKDFLVAQVIKSLPVKTVHAGSTPGSGRCPGEGIGSILAWRIPWTKEPVGLPSTGSKQSIGSQRVGYD